MKEIRATPCKALSTGLPATIMEVYQMAYQISGDCISCGLCASNCPVEAIAAGDEHYEINADACIDCGTCADNCPVEAIAQA